MWFPLTPAEIGFVDRARRQFSYDFHVAASPEAVFEAITEPEVFARWFPDYRGARWLSPPPHGTGSVREVKLRGLAVRERIVVYEPGQRFAFTITKMSRPLLKRMVEDYRLAPTDDGGTRVVWTIAYRPRLAVRPLEPLLKPVFGRLFERAAAALRDHLAGA